jgi:hypothetical protein
VKHLARTVRVDLVVSPVLSAGVVLLAAEAGEELTFGRKSAGR